MWIIRTFLIIARIGLIVGFVLFNSYQQVKVNFFGTQYPEVSLISVIFFSFIVGMLTTFILVVVFVMKSQGELRRQKKENKKLLEEITALRNMPLEDLEEKEDSGV